MKTCIDTMIAAVLPSLNQLAVRDIERIKEFDLHTSNISLQGGLHDSEKSKTLIVNHTICRVVDTLQLLLTLSKALGLPVSSMGTLVCIFLSVLLIFGIFFLAFDI